MDSTKTPALAVDNLPFTALAAMVYDPMRAFALLEQRRAAWLPLLIVVTTSVALLMWYYAVVDFDWLKEKMVAIIPEVEKREQAMAMVSKGVIEWSSIIASAVGIPIIAAITGLYFMLAAKVMKVDFSFGKGFALAAWGTLPTAVTSIIGYIQLMLTTNGQLDFSQLNPLSVNQLVFQYEVGSTWASFLDTLNLGTGLSILLMICGFQVWAKVSRASAAVVTLLPCIVILGIWIAINMSKVA